MSALASPRSPAERPIQNQPIPLAAGVKAWAGAAIYLDTSVNFARPGIAGNPNLIFAGVAQETVDNTAGANGGAYVVVALPEEFNCQWFDNVAGAGAITSLFGLAYVNDDHSVTGLASVAGLQNSIVGRVWGVDSLMGVLVQPFTGLPESVLGQEAEVGGNPAYKARAVVTSLPAYTGGGASIMTASANGAWPAQDGVADNLNDVFFVQAGQPNLLSANDSGPWQLTSLGGASSKWTAQRPAWWAAGAAYLPGAVIEIGGEGPIFGGTSWKVFSAAGNIGTADPGFYVGRINFTAQLGAGTLAFAAGTFPCGIRAAKAQLDAVCNTSGGAVTSTVSYGQKAAPTPGYLGVAAWSVFALAAGQSTNATDTSLLSCELVNW